MSSIVTFTRWDTRWIKTLALFRANTFNSMNISVSSVFIVRVYQKTFRIYAYNRWSRSLFIGLLKHSRDPRGSSCWIVEILIFCLCEESSSIFIFLTFARVDLFHRIFKIFSLSQLFFFLFLFFYTYVINLYYKIFLCDNLIYYFPLVLNNRYNFF